MGKDTVVVGPCKCGGYGVVYNEETAEKLGRCHDDLDSLKRHREEYRCPHCLGVVRPVPGSDSTLMCEGDKQCQFMGPKEEFDVARYQELSLEEVKQLRADKVRLDFVQNMGDDNKKPWVLRKSGIHRGWRLHQTTRAEGVPCIREAIDKACAAATSDDEKMPEEGYYYIYTALEESPSLVYLYENTDAGCWGFGFNTHEGGGFLPLGDLAKGSRYVPVEITVD